MRQLDLYDPLRRREIPVAHYPASGPARGWILFSVGFGGQRQGYAFLGRAWSQLGFEVAVVEHVGSNLAVLKQIHRPGMRQAELAQVVGVRARDPQEMRDRPQDLAFVRQSLCPEATWVGLGGHSFGAYTAMATALAASGPWRGVLAMSPQPPDTALSTQDLMGLGLPTLLITGTRDSGMPAGVSYQQRLESYRLLPAGQKYLALLAGADHMALAGVGLAVEPVVTSLLQITGHFWSSLHQGLAPDWKLNLPLEVHFESQ